MATVIIAKNQTAGALPLDKLPIPDNTLPASPATVTLTDYCTVGEIQNDAQLSGYVAVGDVVLNLDGVDLTTAEATNVTSPVVSVSSTTIETETSTSGGTGNAGKVLALDANGKADGLIAGDAVSHIADVTTNPHNVTATQVGAASSTHASNHTNGTDDIQSATASQKGLMTLTYASKLDGIEAGADVTDATNVAAAGAVMKSDWFEVTTWNPLSDVKNSGAYSAEAYLYVPSGTSAPTAMKVLGYVEGPVNGKVRVYDATNATVICENTGFTNTTVALADLGTISNWPSGAAILELHIGSDGADKMIVGAWGVEY